MYTFCFPVLRKSRTILFQHGHFLACRKKVCSSRHFRRVASTSKSFEKLIEDSDQLDTKSPEGELRDLSILPENTLNERDNDFFGIEDDGDAICFEAGSANLEMFRELVQKKPRDQDVIHRTSFGIIRKDADNPVSGGKRSFISVKPVSGALPTGNIEHAFEDNSDISNPTKSDTSIPLSVQASSLSSGVKYKKSTNVRSRLRATELDEGIVGNEDEHVLSHSTELLRNSARNLQGSGASQDDNLMQSFPEKVKRRAYKTKTVEFTISPKQEKGMSNFANALHMPNPQTTSTKYIGSQDEKEVKELDKQAIVLPRNYEPFTDSSNIVKQDCEVESGVKTSCDNFSSVYDEQRVSQYDKVSDFNQNTQKSVERRNHKNELACSKPNLGIPLMSQSRISVAESYTLDHEAKLPRDEEIRVSDKPSEEEQKETLSNDSSKAYNYVLKQRKSKHKGALLVDGELKLGELKLDSKGFKILTNQVADLSQLTTDELIIILKNRVLYSNDDVLVIDKPYNFIIHEAQTNKGPCLSAVLDGLAHTLDNKSENPSLFTVHRLDKETTGCLILARNEFAAQQIKALFAQQKIVKKYWIVTSKVPNPEEGIIDIPIAEGSIDNKARMVLCPDIPKDMKYKSHCRHGKRAITHYRVISTSGNAALVEVMPETGLKHQIRVHFGFGLGCPIIGDHKYSHLDKLAPQKLPSDILQRLQVRQSKVRYVPMHIHARSIVIPQFLDGQNLFVNAPLPDHMGRNLRSLKFRKN